MLKYEQIKPKVYIETTVVSYLYTPAELIEERQMKEKEHPPMDPILEECYKMKEEFAARFKTMQELVDYLKAENKKNKAEGWKYVSFPPVKYNKQD